MLLDQNRKLKAELYEAHKIINGMCKDIKTVINGVQKKLHDTDDREDSPIDDRDSELSCPFEELPTKVLIGSGKTEVDRQVYTQINWSSYAGATRKLLMAVFPRDVLATHSLTGKPSPAFQHLISDYIPSKSAYVIFDYAMCDYLMKCFPGWIRKKLPILSSWLLGSVESAKRWSGVQ